MISPPWKVTSSESAAEVDARLNGNPVAYSFPGRVCYVFSKETGLNLEA